MRKTKTQHNNRAKKANIEVNSSIQSASLTRDLGVSPSLKGLRQEYTEVNNNIRHYSTLRFAIFTVYFAALGGLISVAFGLLEDKSANPEQLKLGGRIGGLLVTALFFHYEYRIEEVLNRKRERGRELESSLGYQQITLRSVGSVSRTHRATQAFYWIVLLFWLVMTIRMFIATASA